MSQGLFKLNMNLTNIYNRPEPVDTHTWVPFTSLKWGNRFQYVINGPISKVHFIGDGYITIRREDDWLVRVTPEMLGWSRMVIKL